MEGIERLENEVLEMNNYNVSVIFDYLKNREDLTKYFNNEEKSIKQMLEYIYEKARKQQRGNVAMISDNVVYLWAITYFSKSNEELGLKAKKVMPLSSTEVVEKIEKNQTKKEEKVLEENNQITLFQEVQ